MQKQPYQVRIYVVLSVFGVVLAGLIVRLYWLQIAHHDYYAALARELQTDKIPIRPKRGNIFDRNREALATSSLRYSLYANIEVLQTNNVNLDALAYPLADVLNKSVKSVQTQLNNEGSPPVARLLEPEVADKVQNFLHSGSVPPGSFYFVRETKRHYPKGRHACHLVGYVQIEKTGENEGIDGLEKQYNKEIHGNDKKFEVLLDRVAGQITPIEDSYWSGAFGHDLILSIEGSLQRLAEDTLREEVSTYKATHGAVIVQNCKSGEILALASFPNYDPGKIVREEIPYHRSFATNIPSGLGSVMKIVTASALIESGKMDLETMVDCHNGVATFPGRREPVRDAPGHVLGVVPFRQAFYLSSNCGFVEAARAMDRRAYYGYLRAFGFGQKTGVDLAYESAGLLRPLEKWTDASMSALPYGSEMLATPLQVANAVSAVANGGLLMKPFVVKEVRTFEGRIVSRTKPAVVRRVVSPATSAKVLELMEGTVGRFNAAGEWESGTGAAAAIPGYRIGGKTGTSKDFVRLQSGDTQTTYVASFAAVMPLPDPQLTIFCCIENPQGEKFGGVVAAPVVRRIAEHALRILRIPANQNNTSPAEVQVTLQRVRENETTEERKQALKGQMPDLRGLTMKEVTECLAGVEMSVSFEGSGVVVSQDPPPLAALASVQECKVVFGR